MLHATICLSYQAAFLQPLKFISLIICKCLSINDSSAETAGRVENFQIIPPEFSTEISVMYSKFVR
jgi:hypothetical protein